MLLLPVSISTVAPPPLTVPSMECFEVEIAPTTGSAALTFPDRLLATRSKRLSAGTRIVTLPDRDRTSQFPVGTPSSASRPLPVSARRVPRTPDTVTLADPLDTSTAPTDSASARIDPLWVRTESESIVPVTRTEPLPDRRSTGPDAACTRIAPEPVTTLTFSVEPLMSTPPDLVPTRTRVDAGMRIT